MGSVAVVTGGTGGIGSGVVLALAERGARVVVGGRDAAKGADVVRRAEMAGAEALFVAGDVRERADMDNLVAAAVDRFGALDVVVANAGGDDDRARRPEVRGPFEQIDLGVVVGFVAGALQAKLNVVQAAVPHLHAGGGGSVVLVTSEGGRTATAGQTAMAASSGGLIMAAKVLARELARDLIRVNCVGVTLVSDSPSWEAFVAGRLSDAHTRQYRRIVEGSPLGIASPEDIGAVVAFLASPESRHLTGATLSPTGGLTIH